MDVETPALEGREDGTGIQGQSSDTLLSRAEAKKQTGLQTREGQYAAIRLAQLVKEDPEHALSKQSMLIDTDPRHVHGVLLDELPLPGLEGPRFTKPRRDGANRTGEKSEEQKNAVTYISRDPAQLAQEESILHDRILYDMKQNLIKLKEYGKASGFAFDISKRKGKDGRMQGEKWVDEELELWKRQALRMIPPPEPKNAPQDPKLTKMEDNVFKLERTLNDLKYIRLQKQREKAQLEEEIAVFASLDEKGDGSADTQLPVAVLSALRERIQDCNQKMLAESSNKIEFEKEHDTALAECRAIKAKISEAESDLAKYANDCDVLRVQIRSHFHDVEKVLAQGKLMTMAEIQQEFQGKYREEIAQRQKLLKKQMKLKEMLREYEERVVVMTKLMQMQYDPNRDSPRRNELKRKGVSFEQVFKTMMERIGESDIARIVDLFQKQAITHNAWTEAVRDQEVRVKLLEEEKRLMACQLKKILAKRSHGVENEVRQVSIDGQKLDMAVERIDAASDRLRHLDGLIAHVKESIRHTLQRMQKYNSSLEVPVLAATEDSDDSQGWLDWIQQFAEAVVHMTPKEDQLAALNRSLDSVQPGGGTSGSAASSHPASQAGRRPSIPQQDPGSVALRLRKMTLAFSQSWGGGLTGDRRSVDLDEAEREELERENNHNLRIRFPPGPQALREQIEREKEEEEQELRTEATEEAAAGAAAGVVTRDEVKRRNARILKQKERERAEREAELRGEKVPVADVKKKGRKAAAAAPPKQSRPATETGLDSPVPK